MTDYSNDVPEVEEEIAFDDPGMFFLGEKNATDIKMKALTEPLPVSDSFINSTRQRRNFAAEPEWRVNIKAVMAKHPAGSEQWYMIMRGTPNGCHTKASQLRTRFLKYPKGTFDFTARDLYPDDEEANVYGVFCKFISPDEPVEAGED